MAPDSDTRFLLFCGLGASTLAVGDSVGPVTELSSMLVPLQTLPGWPKVDDPSALQVLGLLVGLPLVAFVVICVMAKIGNTVQASRGTANTDTDPVWVGGPTRPEIGGDEHEVAVADAEDVAELPGTQIEGGARSGDQAAAAGRDVGGAGARW